ncbi:MAG: TonB-dependent receptor, partial [Candidatus Eisenbacteria bacterium]
DVVRGPASILFGPSTIGGVVNLITDVVPEVSGRPLSGTATVEGSTGSDQYAGYFNSVFSGARHAFQVSAGGVHAQNVRIPAKGYEDPESGTVFELDRMPHSFDRSHEEGLGYAWQGETATFGIGTRHYEMNYGITGTPPNDDWMNVPPGTSRIAERRNTVQLRSAFGAMPKRWKLDANFNDYYHSEFPTEQDAGGVFDVEEAVFHKLSYNARLQRQHGGGKLQGTIGAWTNIEKLEIEGEEPLGPTSLTTGLAGYVFEELHASERTRLQAGLRYDYNRIHTEPDPSSPDSAFQTLDEARLSNAVTASLGVIHKLGGEVSASLSVARSFRAPTVQELFADGVDAPSGTFTIGTADLEPETGFGLDASLKGSFRNVKFEVSPYANFVQHYIYGFLRGDTLENLPVRKFSATDARLVGFEASLAIAVAPHVALELASDYVRAQDTESDVPLPFTPPLRGLVRAGYQSDRASGSVEWRLAAAQDRLGDGDTPTTGYGLLNLGVGIRRARGSAVHDLSLHCDNVFDRDYRDHLSIKKDFLPQPGRAVRLNYTLSY